MVTKSNRAARSFRVLGAACAAALATTFAGAFAARGVFADDCPWKKSSSGGTETAASCGAKGSKKTIVETAVEAGSFKTLAAALGAAGLVETLSGKGPFTVFAPTDEAFAKLPAGTVENLLKPENKALLTSILTYHVVAGCVPSSEAKKLDYARTVQGQHVQIEKREGRLTVGGARVVKADVYASNGVIHVIDAVMLPNSSDIVATAVAAGSFKTLAQALAAANLVEALKGKGPFTVFAPTDEAFAKLPEGTIATLLQPENREKLAAVLKYHVVAGKIYAADAVEAKKATTLLGAPLSVAKTESGVSINGARVVRANVDASNGVIHVIDTVLLPPST
ncbi:MAG: fasciclin domain-containing protein [Planctomycetota bacterium]